MLHNKKIRNPIIEEDLKYITDSPLPWQSLEGKKILITGASGFVPAYMVETILYLNETVLKKKARIFALVRDIKKAKTRFSYYSNRKDLEFIVQDVSARIKNKKFDIIIHAASPASPKYYGKDPIGTLSPNVIGTYFLLDLAKKCKAEKFLFFSSGEIYGEVTKEQVPYKENIYGYTDPLAIRSCYAESKKMAENMCACWNYQHNLNTLIVRPFHTYGPGMRLDDGRIFADLVSDIVNKRDLSLNSDGSAVRSFLYLADATIGFFTVLFKGIPGNAYNVGNEKGIMSIKELAELLVNSYPERGLSVKVKPSSTTSGYLASTISRAHPDTSKLKALGWDTKISIKDGFIRTIRSIEWKTN